MKIRNVVPRGTVPGPKGKRYRGKQVTEVCEVTDGGVVVLPWGKVLSPSEWSIADLCAETDEEKPVTASEAASDEEDAGEAGGESSPKPRKSSVRAPKKGRTRQK